MRVGSWRVIIPHSRKSHEVLAGSTVPRRPFFVAPVRKRQLPYLHSTQPRPRNPRPTYRDRIARSGVILMWQPQGDKLNNPDRLGNLKPVTALSDTPTT